jgi:hypothetical protein
MPAVSLPLPVTVILPALLPCTVPLFTPITTAFTLVEAPEIVPELLFVRLSVPFPELLIPLKLTGLVPSSFMVPLLLMVSGG